MAAAEIHKHITAVPFLPFNLHVTDGRTLSVYGRNFILISPIGTVVDLFQPDGEHDIIATGAITGITYIPDMNSKPSKEAASF